MYGLAELLWSQYGWRNVGDWIGSRCYPGQASLGIFEGRELLRLRREETDTFIPLWKPQQVDVFTHSRR